MAARPLASRREWLIAAAALALYAAQALFAARTKSPVFDEVAHVTAGVSYWTERDFRLQPENGNWPQRLIGLGVLAGGHRMPPPNPDGWATSDAWMVGDSFFAPVENAPGRVVMLGRTAIVIVAALLGALVFAWSRSLFGAMGGWITLGLYVFSPTMLAHGAIATSDLVATAFFTASTWALWRVTQRVTATTVVLSCVSVAGLFLSKFSAPIVIPIALVLVVARLISRTPVVVEWRGEKRSVDSLTGRLGIYAAIGVAHTAVTVAIIWASYDFRFDAMATASPDARMLIAWDRVLPATGTLPAIVARVREWRLLPEAWIYGFGYVAFFSQTRASFLNGVFSGTGGIPGFFPYAAAVKETIPALALIAISLATLVRNRGRAPHATDGAARKSEAWSFVPVLALIVVYGAVAMSSDLNIGHRHLLPIIPASYVLAGATGTLLNAQRFRRWAGPALGGLVFWHAAESARIAPNYLAYFNELDGGPREAYRHLVDSSLDWGQDLPGLKRWLDEHGLQRDGADPVYLSYFGSVSPLRYGIRATHLPGFFDWMRPHRPEVLRGGTYCISATMLQSTYLYAFGPWTPEREREYQEMRGNLGIYAAAVGDSTKLRALLNEMGDMFWVRTFSRFEDSRFARLAAYLRQREPDDAVGYSILIYRLTDAEVDAAVNGPPPY